MCAMMQKFLIIACSVCDGEGSTAAPADALARDVAAVGGVGPGPAGEAGPVGIAGSDIGGTVIQSVGEVAGSGL